MAFFNNMLQSIQTFNNTLEKANNLHKLEAQLNAMKRLKANGNSVSGLKMASLQIEVQNAKRNLEIHHLENKIAELDKKIETDLDSYNRPQHLKKIRANVQRELDALQKPA
jgi:hypothetical protein